MKQAKEPSNIIWQNRQITHKERSIRQILWILLMIWIQLSFFEIASGYLIKMLSYKYLKDPPGVDCKSVENQYSSTLQAMAYSEEATLSFERLNSTAILSLDLMSRQGYLTCFCQQ